MSIAILLACCGCASALDPSLDVSQYAHNTWKIRDGFARGVITSLAQTPDGYVWVGTESGLLRFDGVRAVPWQPPIGQQLPGNLITSLLAARDGTLWIGTFSGPASWKDGKLKRVRELAGRNVTSLLEARDGTVWIGVYGDSGGTLCDIRSGPVHCDRGSGMLGTGVKALYEDSEGTLWLGSQNGVWRWKPGAPEFFSVPNEPFGIISFAEDEHGQVLFGSHAGVRRLVNGRVEPYSLSASAYPWQVTQMFRDRDGGLWVGTSEHGLVHIQKQGRTDVFSHTDGISGDYVTRFLEDREGNIWVATYDGIDRFREYAIPTISTKEGLSSTGGWSVLGSKDGSVWIASNHALSQWTNGQISLFGSRGAAGKSDGKLNGRPPLSLFQDSSSRIWASNSIGEVGYLQDDRFFPVPNLPRGVAYSMAEVPSGHLWVANQQAGLFQLFEGHVLQRIPWAGLGRKDFAKVIIADPSQRGLWLGYREGGVDYFADGKIRASYSAESGLGDGPVTDLRFGTRGALWASTASGLSRIKDGHVATLTSKNGLPCDKVVATIEDNDYSVWLNLACGLVRITQAELDAWVSDPSRVVSTKLFDTYDGVRTHSASGGFQPLMTKSADGKIWFLPWDGVSVFDPHHLPFNKLPPPVHIEEFTADDKDYEISNGMRLPAGVRKLDIDYTALSLVLPEKVRFRVKLEGQDKDWRELVNDRHVHYTNLAPKHYRFRVLACNNSGVWNEEGASLDFVIPPAFYQTNWFRALCVAIFASIIWAVHRLRVRALEKRQALLEQHQTEIRALNEQMIKAQEAERMRISGDLHDGVLQQITSLTLRLGKVRRQVPPDSEATATVNSLQQQLIQIGTDIRHISHELHPALLQEAGLPAALSSYCEEFSNVRGLPVSCETDESVRELSPGAALCLYRIAQEALGNAAKYSQARKVEVRLTRSNGLVRLTVSDDGVGCDPERIGKSGGLGVINMRERVLQLRGTFEFKSETGRGTTVKAEVPFRPAS
jgi:signal transduction histidine kinase/ligand-binding sensor domain-containing protein